MNADFFNNWCHSTIGDVCDPPQYGWTTSSCESGKIKLLRTTDITSGSLNWGSVPFCRETPKEIEKYQLHKGDIVISRAGSVGFSYLIENIEPAVFASYLIRFIPKSHIDSKFIAYYLKSPNYWNAISENKLGIAIPNVNASKIKTIPFSYPELSEQKAIVAKIDELFSPLDAAEAALKRARAST